MWAHRPYRRFAGALVLATYAALTLALPLAHLARHANDHVHLADGSIRWESVQSPRTGRVDLAKLAQALGLDAKGRRHDESKPHHHDAGTPLDHGRDAPAHFGVALHTPDPSPVLVAPTAEVVELSRELTSQHVPARLALLETQRGQAPPA